MSMPACFLLQEAVSVSAFSDFRQLYRSHMHTQPTPPPPIRYYMSGCCMKGDQCTFSHEWTDKPDMVCATEIVREASSPDNPQYVLPQIEECHSVVLSASVTHLTATQYVPSNHAYEWYGCDLTSSVVEIITIPKYYWVFCLEINIWLILYSTTLHIT